MGKQSSTDGGIIQEMSLILIHLHDILPQPTAHSVGQKRVLFKQAETDTNLKQIAITTLQAGEATEEHSHPTIEECFFFLNGETKLTIKGNVITCHEGDFVQVKCGEQHKLEAVKVTRELTIGIQI